MEGDDVIAKARAVKMDVNLGGCDALMSEHLLDGAEIGAPFEQMGGEGVAEGMGRNIFSYPCGRG